MFAEFSCEVWIIRLNESGKWPNFTTGYGVVVTNLAHATKWRIPGFKLVKQIDLPTNQRRHEPLSIVRVHDCCFDSIEVCPVSTIAVRTTSKLIYHKKRRTRAFRRVRDE